MNDNGNGNNSYISALFGEQYLNKMDDCRHLLPDPGPEVAGQLIAEVRRLRLALERIRNFPVHSEPVGGAYAMQNIAHETLSPNAPHEPRGANDQQP